MYVNWEGLKKFLGWKGSIEDMKRLKLPEVQPVTEKSSDEIAIRHVPLVPSDKPAVKNDVRRDFHFESYAGFKMIYLNADEETRNRLSSQGVLTPYEDEDKYRFRIQEGDIVRLQDGRLGTVRMIEYNVGGHEKVASVDVDGAPRRWFGLRAPLPLRFADGEIHYLKFVATKEEMDAALAECDE